MIKAAVIGVGHLGYHHTRILKSLPQVNLVGIVDTNPERAKEVGEEFSVPYFHDYKELLSKADAFVIASPTTAHFEITTHLMEREKHILVEKPVTATMEEFVTLTNMSKDYPKVLTVCLIERFNPALKALGKNLESPFYFISERLGRFSNRALDVDVVKDLMIHDLDIIFTLAGREIAEIRAVGIPVVTDKTDIANVVVEFKNGSVANLTASRVSMEKVRKVRVFQRNSYFNLDYTIQEVFLTRVFQQDLKRIVIPVDKAEPLSLELTNFIKAVAGEEETEVKLDQALFAVEQADMISRMINEQTHSLFHSKG